MSVRALAAIQPRATLTDFAYEPAEPGPWQVVIGITHCGICHSDIHLIDDDWGMSTYPLVPGHEIVGRIEAVGSMVGPDRVGQRVGVGWQRGSCMQCEWCVRGDENLCASSQATCVGHHGGFADRIVVDGRFAFPVPEALPSETAAPLLCGGATVFSPLRRFGVTADARVGVVGIGGLGHLALQFASAFGCEVTALSSTPAKADEARALGAHRFVALSDPAALKSAASSIDFLMVTGIADQDWTGLLNLLRPDGTLCVLGAVAAPVTVPAFPLIIGRKSICGSNIGSRTAIGEMLAFAARHGITARTEVLPMARANDAIARVRAGAARYRMVLAT